MIPHNRPWITAEDREAVDSVLASGWIAQGPKVEALELAFTKLYGGGAACAVSSGTSSLFLALRALGVGVGSQVAVPSYACSALLNAVYMAGAVPKVVDVTLGEFVIDPDAVQRQAPDAETAIAVHTYGAKAPVGTLQAMGLKVIEDCCQSLGGYLDERPLGSDGDAAIFSFYATKVVSGGQGGMVWSKNATLVEAIRDYRQFDCREEYYPRFNFQLTDIQASMILSQLERLDTIRARRAAIAARYAEAAPPEFRFQEGINEQGRLAYRFVLVAPDKEARDELLAHLCDAEVGCIIPVERHELLHRYLRLDASLFPVAEQLAELTLSLPIYPSLHDADIEVVCSALRSFSS